MTLFSILRRSSKGGFVILLLVSLCFQLTACDESSMNGSGDPDSGAMGLEEIISASEDLDCSLGTTFEKIWVQCSVLTSFYPLNWNDYEDAVNEYLAGEGYLITDDSIIYIEGKGGKGGDGGGSFTNSGGGGGAGGYARTASTIGNLKDDIFEENVQDEQIEYDLYILVADRGGKHDNGGDGGSSTILIGKQIIDIESGSSQPEDERVIVVAGGGGGGGAGEIGASGNRGGGGADAFAITNRADSTRGSNGKGPNSESGNGGNRASGGERTGLGGKGAKDADNGTSGIGGKGGANLGRSRPSWVGDEGNADSHDFGYGGNASGVGGGGGAGFGGGGGGTTKPGLGGGAGGGGGGSWARKITFNAGNFGIEGPFVGKSNMPSNSNNGSVVFTIEVFSISE